MCERGECECVALKSLPHRFILPVYGVYRGSRRGSVCKVTELYETTLEELMSMGYAFSLVLGVCGCEA